MSEDEKKRFERLKLFIVESKLETSFNDSDLEPAAEEFVPIR